MPKTMPIYEELRYLTRLYMARNQLSQKAMGDLIGASQRSIAYWAFSDKPKVLKEESLNHLVELFRDERLVATQLGTKKADRAMERVLDSIPECRVGRPIKAMQALREMKFPVE